MSMETVLERIAVALEKLVGGSAANPGVDLVPVVVVPKKAKKAPEKSAANELFGDDEKKPEEAKITEESVRDVIKKFAEAKDGNVEIAQAMLAKQFKVKKLREIKPEQYAEVVEVFTEALNG